MNKDVCPIIRYRLNYFFIVITPILIDSVDMRMVPLERKRNDATELTNEVNKKAETVSE